MINKFRGMKKILTLFLIVVSFGIARAEEGQDALSFTRISRNIAVLGVGGAGNSSTTSVAWASFSNSAVLPFYDGEGDFGVSYQYWAPNTFKTSNFNFGGAYKLNDKVGFSIGAVYQSGQKYDIYNDSGNYDGTFHPSETIFNIGAGYKLTNHLSAGVNLRYAYQKLTSSGNMSGFGGDFHLLYHFKGGNVSIGVNNLGTKVEDSNGNKYFPSTSANIDGIYSYDINPKNAVSAALDTEYFFSGHLTAAFGAEYAYDNMVFVRAGFHYGAEDAAIPSFISMGAGYKYQNFKIDLVYLTGNQNIGNTFGLGLGYSF